MKAIYEEKLITPDDISFITFDDIDFAPDLFSPLTAVSQPNKIMGEITIKLPIDIIIMNKSNTQRIVLKPQLIARNSVKLLIPNEMLLPMSPSAAEAK